jgi:hypothetical protein
MVARNWDSAQSLVAGRADVVATDLPGAEVCDVPAGEPAAVVAAVVVCAVGADGPTDDGPDEVVVPDPQPARPKKLMATSATAVLKFFMVLSLMRVG